MVELNPDEMIKTYIHKARFEDEVMNELVRRVPFSRTEVLQQIDVLWANADQSPRDAQKASMLLEFIDGKIPEIVSPIEADESRADRHTDKMQKRDPHFDRRALDRKA